MIDALVFSLSFFLGHHLLKAPAGQSIHYSCMALLFLSAFDIGYAYSTFFRFSAEFMGSPAPLMTMKVKTRFDTSLAVLCACSALGCLLFMLPIVTLTDSRIGTLGSVPAPVKILIGVYLVLTILEGAIAWSWARHWRPLVDNETKLIAALKKRDEAKNNGSTKRVEK